MAAPRPPDAVDAILAQWQRERPDLDASPMGPIGRIKRCSVLLERRLDETFAQFNLSRWEFDMLARCAAAARPIAWRPPHCSQRSWSPRAP